MSRTHPSTSPHGSVSGGRAPPITPPAKFTLTATPTRYKLNAKLTLLDPTATLLIDDWLINLRAAAGAEFKLVFASDDELDDFYRRLSGQTDKTLFPPGSLTGQFNAWYTQHVAALSVVLFGWILNNVEWQKDPELKRRIKGSNDEIGFIHNDDGRGVYL